MRFRVHAVDAETGEALRSYTVRANSVEQVYSHAESIGRKIKSIETIDDDIETLGPMTCPTSEAIPLNSTLIKALVYRASGQSTRVKMATADLAE